MTFFEKLMLARQVSFKGGRVEVLGGQRLMLFQQKFLANFTEDIIKDAEAARALYKDCRKDMAENFIRKVLGSHGAASKKEVLSLLGNVAGFAGWGVYRYESIDEAKPRVVINMGECIVGSALRYKVSAPCDHIFRGFVAGGTSRVYGKELECVESSCIALGDEHCRFVASVREELKKEFPELYGVQVGD